MLTWLRHQTTLDNLHCSHSQIESCFEMNSHKRLIDENNKSAITQKEFYHFWWILFHNKVIFFITQRMIFTRKIYLKQYLFLFSEGLLFYGENCFALRTLVLQHFRWDEQIKKINIIHIMLYVWMNLLRKAWLQVGSCLFFYTSLRMDLGTLNGKSFYGLCSQLLHCWQISFYQMVHGRYNVMWPEHTV